MWVLIPLPKLEQRIRGFTFPARGELLLWAADGLHRVELVPQAAVHRVLAPEEVQPLFDAERCRLNWQGQWVQVHGADGGDIPLGDHPNGDRLEADLDRELLLVTDQSGQEVRQVIEGFAISAGWAVAGFSEDGRYLVVCHPAELRVFHQAVPAVVC